MADAPELVYRSRAFAIVGWAMLAVVVLAVVTVFIDRPSPAGLWLVCAVLGGAALAWLVVRCYIAPRVVSSADGVRVVNPFKTTRIRWRDIERFEARPMLRVVRRDGTHVTAWAVQAATTSRLVGRTGLAEPVASALTRQLAATSVPPPPPPGLNP
jgi:hypothetical protein